MLPDFVQPRVCPDMMFTGGRGKNDENDYEKKKRKKEKREKRQNARTGREQPIASALRCIIKEQKE